MDEMSVPPPTPHEDSRLLELHALGLLDTEPEEVFDRITRLAQRLLGVPIALVSLVDADRQWFKSRQGLDALETPRSVAFCHHAIRGDDVMVVENAAEDPRFSSNPLVMGDPNIRFYAGAPVRSPSGHCLGTLCVIDETPRSPSEEDLDALRDLASIAEGELTRMAEAVTDSLTGLRNRRGFLGAGQRALVHAGERGERVFMAFVDLDGLKAINDSEGHQAGDGVLVEAARLLDAAVPDAAVLARLGGDEFALLWTAVEPDTAAAVLRRIRDAAAAAHRRGCSDRPLAMSIGCVERHEGENLDDLLARADAEMYVQKRLRRRLRQSAIA